MAQAIESGHLIDAILAFTVLEWLVLALHHRRSGAGVAPTDISRNILSGLCLMLALRTALVGGWWGWIAVSLLGSFLAHLADLLRLWRPAPRREAAAPQARQSPESARA